jgi:hypothetical protein
MPSIAIVISANARHASSAEATHVSSAEPTHVASAETTTHVSSAAETPATAAVSSPAAAAATAATACLCARRKQRPGQQGACQYHHHSSSCHDIFLSTVELLLIIESDHRTSRSGTDMVARLRIANGKFRRQ